MVNPYLGSHHHTSYVCCISLNLNDRFKHLGGLKITDLVEEGLGPFLHSLRPNARADVVAERLRAALEKEDGSPATAAASSWLTED